MDAAKLKSVDLFSSLSDEEAERIAQWTDEIEVETGHHLIRQDGFGYEFFEAIEWQQRHTTYPVFDGERVVGLLPFGRVASLPREKWAETRIESVMVPLSEVVLLDEHAPLGEAIGSLAASDLQRGLVIEDGRLVGLVSVSDIARAFERRARMI